MKVGVHWHAPAALPPGRVPVAIEGSCLGPRAGLDGLHRRESSLFPPRIETWTVQIVVNRHTGYANTGPQLKSTNYMILSLVTVSRLVSK